MIFYTEAYLRTNVWSGTLPLPPSDNNLSRKSSHGSYPSAEYLSWLKIAGPICDDYAFEYMPERAKYEAALAEVNEVPYYKVECLVNMPRGRRDLTNHIKASMDLLSGRRLHPDLKGKTAIDASKAIWKDDSRIVRLEIETGMLVDEPDMGIIVKFGVPPSDERRFAEDGHACTIARAKLKDRPSWKCAICDHVYKSPTVPWSMVARASSAVPICSSCVFMFHDNTLLAVKKLPTAHWENVFTIIEGVGFHPTRNWIYEKLYMGRELQHD